METATNLAKNATSVASKLIWGEGEQTDRTATNETGGQEPVSGLQGKGTIDEPFDQGNKDDPTNPRATSTKPTITATGDSFNSATAAMSTNTTAPTLDNPTGAADNSGLGSTGKPDYTPDFVAIDKKPTSTFHQSSTSHEHEHEHEHGQHSGLTGSILSSGAEKNVTDNNPVLGREPATGHSQGGESGLTSSMLSSGADKNVTDNNPVLGHDVASESHGRDIGGGSLTSGTDIKHTDTKPSTEHNPLIGDSQGHETGQSDSHPKVPHHTENAATGGEAHPMHDTEKTGVVGDMGRSTKFSDIKPSEAASNTGAAPSSATQPTPKQQGADRPTEAPKGEEKEAVKSTKDEAEDILKKRDPNDHSGEPMKMHGGPESSDKKTPSTQAERRDSKAGNPGGQEHGKEYGTGDEWVKTTGLAADGGDFDATKPGAGKEANRILETKGIEKTQPGQPAPAHPMGGSEEKESLGHKLKTKLHIGHKDK